MGGLLGGVLDWLIGSPSSVEIPEPDWEELAKLLELGITRNRYNISNPFTSYEWDEDKENLTQTVNPSVMPGYERVIGRFNEGPQRFDGPGQRAALLQAMVQRQPPRRERPVIPERPGPRDRRIPNYRRMS